MIDLHCHLDLYPDPDCVLARVIQENMYVLAVTTTPRAWQWTCKLVEHASRVRVALGLHPQLVAERHEEVDLLCSLLAETRYVGEIGLDGSPQCRQSLALQQEAFDRILAACARVGGRILSVHSRGATKVVLDALQSYPDAGTPVLHWFSGTLHDLQRAAVMGCWFSVGPAMLMTKKGLLLAEQMPADRVVTETDGPFARWDGEALAPWDVAQAVRALATIWNMDPAAAGRQIAANCRTLLEHGNVAEPN